MRRLLTVCAWLMAAFGVASGGYKVAGGAADLAVFAHLGMAPALVRLFGLVQAAAGLTLPLRRTGTAAALVLVACNLLATAGLFAAGVQPFGWTSFLFVVMAAAAVPWARARARERLGGPERP